MKLTRNNFILLYVEVLLLIAVLLVPDRFAPQAYIIVADIFVALTITRIIRTGFQDIPLFFFNITYEVFVLGGSTVSILKSGSVENYISVSLTDHQLMVSCGIALFGIACMDITYYLFEDKKNSTVRRQNADEGPTKIQEQAVAAIFIVAAICKLAMAVETMTYSTAFGYVSLYTRETSNLPGMIRYIGAFFYFSLMLLLTCNFSKTITYAAFGATAIIEAVILKSGDRGEAVCGILVLVIYTMLRCRREPNFLIHKKTAVIGLCCSLPFFTFLLQVIKYTRIGNATDISFGEAIFEFFESQGVSINIIANELKHYNEITAIGGHTYVINQIISYLQQNVLFRTIFGFERIAGNTVEMAMSGFSLGATIMYIILPGSYLQGIGCGTCYLAELYQDAKWIGLVAGTILIVALLKWIKKADQRNWIESAMMLNCMRIVLMLPRGAFLKWLTEILSVPNLMLLFAIYFIGYMAKRKEGGA